MPHQEHTSRNPMKEAAPPWWKRRPSSLVDASLNPFNRWSDDGIEASGLRHLGPSRPGVWLKSLLRAPQTVQVECQLAWRSVHCPPKDQPHNWWKLLEQGPKQSGCFCVCSGGVSAMVGSSDSMRSLSTHQWTYRSSRIAFQQEVNESEIACKAQADGSWWTMLP